MRHEKSISSVTRPHDEHHRGVHAARTDYTYHGDGFPGGEGDDVGAGDDAGALLLELRLGGVDDVQAAQALVLVVVHLRGAARAGDQHRRVAPLRARTHISHSLTATLKTL
jgi:hypothetical protein